MAARIALATHNPHKVGEIWAILAPLVPGLTRDSVVSAGELGAPAPIEDGTDYGATMETSEGTITIDLDEAEAPGTVNNFVVLAKYGWFNGDDFHRVVPGFVAQGGDPVGSPQGTGGPGYTIPDELPTGAYAKGDVAMANTGSPHTGGSQFFLCDTGCSTLPPQYSLFGKVTSGMDVVKKIEASPTTSRGPMGDVPQKPIVIESATVVGK